MVTTVHPTQIVDSLAVKPTTSSSITSLLRGKCSGAHALPQTGRHRLGQTRGGRSFAMPAWPSCAKRWESTPRPTSWPGLHILSASIPAGRAPPWDTTSPGRESLLAPVIRCGPDPEFTSRKKSVSPAQPRSRSRTCAPGDPGRSGCHVGRNGGRRTGAAGESAGAASAVWPISKNLYRAYRGPTRSAGVEWGLQPRRPLPACPSSSPPTLRRATHPI